MKYILIFETRKSVILAEIFDGTPFEFLCIKITLIHLNYANWEDQCTNGKHFSDY